MPHAEQIRRVCFIEVMSAQDYIGGRDRSYWNEILNTIEPPH